MGLTTQDVGVIYGTFACLTIGGILEVLSFQRWIRKMDVTMILAMHLPIIGFILLSHFHPGSVFLATVIAEQFGYGFGFAAFMMYLIYVADGESKRLIIYRNRIYGFRNDASECSAVISKNIWGIFLYLGVFGNYSRINFYLAF
jgi:hypothetical protein